MPIKFTKMHGIGNDYVYIDCFEAAPADPARLAIEMSPRHTAIGADGIILILPSDKGDGMMRIFNADGSEGMMCGNGIRCVAKWLYDHGRTGGRTRLLIDTMSGVKTIDLQVGPDGKACGATVDMGLPALRPADIPADFAGEQMREEPVEIGGGLKLAVTAVGMGNPHGVVFIDTDPMAYDVHGIGRQLECHPVWPERANIEFVRPLADGSVEMRVWERGSGETMACGTGACAAAVASVLTGRAKWPVTVRLRGGDLVIDRRETDGHIMMTGPAAEAFEGVWPGESLVKGA